MNKQRQLWFLGVLAILVLLATGCMFGTGDDDATGDAIDPPQEDYTTSEDEDVLEFDLSIEDGGEAGTEENGQEGETGEEGTTEEEGVQNDENEQGEEEASAEVERQVYVFDHQGYVAPLTVQLPRTESVATQALEHMVIDGPITPLLPDGMRAVLPPGTQLSVNVLEDEETAVVDFSPEFEDYAAEDEKGILEAVTWTLTQFDGIEQVQIQINGEPQEVMPVGETPINEVLSRADGINIELSDDARVGDSSMVTLYFQAQSQNGEHDYYVPVSRLVPRHENLVEATMEQFIAGPSFDSGLYSALPAGTEVLAASEEDGRAVIDVDEQFLSLDSEEATASDEVLHSLVLSLSESTLVEEVQLSVNGETNVQTRSGRDLSEPVTIPPTINTASF